MSAQLAGQLDVNLKNDVFFICFAMEGWNAVSRGGGQRPPWHPKADTQSRHTPEGLPVAAGYPVKVPRSLPKANAQAPATVSEGSASEPVESGHILGERDCEPFGCWVEMALVVPSLPKILLRIVIGNVHTPFIAN